MAVSPRTRPLLSWLPAAIALLVIAGVVVAALAIQGSWWLRENPVASADQRATDGSSMLTDAGFDYVNVEGVVRVRVGAGGLPAAELGMPADGERTAQFRRPVRAVIAAGDDVFVLDDVLGLTATSAGDALTSVSLVPDASGSWSGAVAYLRSLAPEFGWDAAQLDPLDAQLAEFNRSADGAAFTAVVGPSSGAAAITGTLVFDRATGGTAVTVDFAPGDAPDGSGDEQG